MLLYLIFDKEELDCIMYDKWTLHQQIQLPCQNTADVTYSGWLAMCGVIDYGKLLQIVIATGTLGVLLFSLKRCTSLKVMVS